MTESPPQTRAVVMERQMPHPPEKVWRALTQSPLIADWLMANDFEPTAGRRFTFRAPPTPQWNGVFDGQVLAVEPCEHLSYSWNASGEAAAGGLKTVVTWTLTPTEDGTHVRMEQTGFRPEDEPNHQGALQGWRRFIAGLERVTASLD